MTQYLPKQTGHPVNRKKTQRLIGRMGIEGMAPGPSTSRGHAAHKDYSYLLRDFIVEQPNQVWCSDITYIPVLHRSLYLVAVMDWFSRYVISWRLCNSMGVDF